VRWTRQGETVYFGVSCPTSLATGDERTLEDFILEQKYPNVRRARTDADYGDVWRLLNQAFKTIDAAPDAGRQDESTITWKKAAWSREGINRIYVLERETDDKQATERLGTIAVSRFYSRTWLIHQLGVDGTKGQALSHQLYGRVLDYLRDTQAARYTLGTFPKDSHVFQQYYLAFIRSDPHPEYHYLEDTNIVEFNVDKARRDLERVIRSIPVTVTPMDAVGAVVVMRALRTQYPKVFLEALDIREYDMALHEVEAIYQAVALTRARKWFVAKTGGAIVGAAYAEWGSESQNVFSLFDNFRLFSFCEDDAVSRAAKCQLLKAVFNTYVENSVKLAITWSRDPEIVEYCPSGKVFFEAYLWLANAVRMKAFLRHLDRLHGRVGIMRSMRRKTPSET
jgi:hypothetical protein